MVSLLEKIEDRKVIQRGKRGAATLLPTIFMQDNNLDRGSKILIGISEDQSKLYLLVSGSAIRFTDETVMLEKEYSLGIHKIKNVNIYPIITLPQKFLKLNGINWGDKIDIYSTPQADCLVISKSEV